MSKEIIVLVISIVWLVSLFSGRYIYNLYSNETLFMLLLLSTIVVTVIHQYFNLNFFKKN